MHIWPSYFRIQQYAGNPNTSHLTVSLLNAIFCPKLNDNQELRVSGTAPRVTVYSRSS